MTALVELFPTAGGWRWRYRSGDVVLESNETYETVTEAEDAARTAYPGVPVSDREGVVSVGTEPSGAIGWLALLLVIVVLLRARKAR